MRSFRLFFFWFKSMFALATLEASSLCASAFVTSSRNTAHSFRTTTTTMPSSSSSSSTCRSSTSTSYLETMAEAASKALGRPVQFTSTSGGGYSGGGGASTSAVMDTFSGVKYFVKAASMGEFNMLHAEYLGVKAMADTHTIQVPTPIAVGQHDQKRAFVLFEYLEFCGGGSEFELGVQLAKMHRCTNDKGFGFDVDNTIGATPQPNLPWMDDWASFWDTHRLGHMLKLTGNAGLSDAKVKELRQKTRELLSHNPAPSLLHGDLWGGNKGYCRKDGKIVPVIFDPATYYGDREADVAMTSLFGGFGSEFYKGYNSEWPLPEGHEKRVEVYNLYHILNHDVLFGGFYLNQAKGMIDRILKS